MGVGALSLATVIGTEITCAERPVPLPSHPTALENTITESDYKQAQHLKRSLDRPLEDFTDLEHLDHLVRSESIVLQLAFYAYALTNMALSDDSYQHFAEYYIDRAIQKAMQPRLRDTFSAYWGDPFDEKNEENVLYRGHLNLMMGAYALVSGDHKYHQMQRAITKALARDFHAAPTAHVQSYPGHRWPADNVVALASLSLYDHICGEDHQDVIARWKQWTQEHLDENGLPYSHINDRTGLPDRAARGCATAFSISFINMFDPAFAKEMYGNFRRTFFKEMFGIPFARESLQDNYPADVDSGPILFNVGSVASAFSIGAARSTGDRDTFTALSRAAEALTLPYETKDGKGYALNNSLGEAVLLYGRTVRPWF